MDKKISIIIPVYNVEKYISRCLDSILANTYQNTEIILVNDGSKDDSQKIIEEYKKKYTDKIILIEQENKGPAEARNVGIVKASGEYIMFIDSDDFIEKDYIENYANQIKEDDYDLVMGGLYRSNDEKNLYEVALKDDMWSLYRIMGPYTRLYKLKFLKENNIEFKKVNIGEDIYFNMQVNKLCWLSLVCK